MKYALVTGATKGIGFGIAEMLLKDGYFVIATYARDKKAAGVCQDKWKQYASRFVLIQANQADKVDMKKLTDYLSGVEQIDCIVCNAGMTLRKGLKVFTDEEWERVMQVNLNSSVYLIRDLADKLANDGRIVFIGSAMGIYPHGTSLAYGVTKAAVHALARNLVKYFEGTNITVNAVAPGFVETEWQKNKPQNIRENICRKTALGRFATVEEIADAVMFCVKNGFVNGSIIEVNGGYNYK